MANSVSRHHHQLTADSAGYVAGIKSAEAATRSLQQQQGKAASASQYGSKAASRFGVVAQQAGYQVQDFAVQVQGGQSALVALGQQGSQLLGVFGVGGAIAGAVLTVGTLVARMYNVGESTKDAKKEAEELKKEYEGIDERLKSVAERWGEINKGFMTRSLRNDPMSISSLESVRSGLESGLPKMELERLGFAGSSAIARARANDTNKTTKERLAFNKQAIDYAEREADVQERILKARERITELEKEIAERRAPEVNALLSNFFYDIDSGAAAKRIEDQVDALLNNFFYNIDNPSALALPQTPAALRANAGASSLGGTAASGDTVLNLQKQTLDVQKQILAEQKRLTSFWGQN